MKLKTRLMMFTAAAALSANMAYAAINPQTLADAYLAQGYSYVEIKVGPTQTKLEGVKGDRKVEVIYDNASGQIIEQEFEDADDDYEGRTGVEIDDSRTDFLGNDDDENDDDENDDESDDAAEDDDDKSGNDDDDNSDNDDDNSGNDDDDSDDSNDSDDDSDEESDSDGDDNSGNDDDGDDN